MTTWLDQPLIHETCGLTPYNTLGQVIAAVWCWSLFQWILLATLAPYGGSAGLAKYEGPSKIREHLFLHVLRVFMCFFLLVYVSIIINLCFIPINI